MQRRLIVLLFALLLFNACLAVGRAETGAAFTTSGGRILKNGAEFVVHGINVNGPGSEWDRKTTLDVDAITKLWKFNLIRVNCRLQPRANNKEPNKKEPNDLDEIVQTFTGRGVVVLLDPHDHAGGYYQDPAVPASSPSLADLIAWQKQMAARYKSNPSVWFEVMDAPGARDEDKKNADLWRDTHDRVLKAIRQDAGASNLVVCEGRMEGTDEPRSGTNPVPEGVSAILTYGPELSRRYVNVAYAFHVDGSWGYGGADKLDDFMARALARNLPLFVSEYGLNGWPDSTFATDAMLAVCRTRHMGRCAWHWFPNASRLCAPDETPGGWQIDTLDSSKPANLSWLGDRVWDDNHSLMPVHGAALDRNGWTAAAFAVSTEGDSHYRQPDNAFSAWTMEEDYWTSNKPQEPGQWFTVDMGAKRVFSRMLLDTRARYSDYPRGYEIYVSSDGANWGKPIAQGKNAQSVLRLSFPTQTAQYLKIVQTGKTWHHWAIANLEVYAPIRADALSSSALSPRGLRPVPRPSAMPLDAGPWLPTSEPKIGDVKAPLLPLRYVGQCASTGKAQQPGFYYQVDMREPQRFRKIVLDCGLHANDYPRGYEVLVSNDGTSWSKPVAAGRGMPITTITFPMQTARYFRIALTRYARNYWAFDSLRVYADAPEAVSPKS